MKREKREEEGREERGGKNWEVSINIDELGGGLWRRTMGQLGILLKNTEIISFSSNIMIHFIIHI